MKKSINIAGKVYNIECELDGDQYCCRILEIDQIYEATEEDIEKRGISMIQAWNKHWSIWGMKNLKTKAFNFKPFGHTLNITLFSPYADKAWFWHYHRAKKIKSFTIRFLGINVYYAEPNAREKLMSQLLEKTEKRINEL